jgi:hypothetical protein
MKNIGKYTYCPSALTIHYREQVNLTIGKFYSIGDGVEIYDISLAQPLLQSNNLKELYDFFKNKISHPKLFT